MGLRGELIELIAEEMVAAEPGLLREDDKPIIAVYLARRCEQFLLDRANDLRLEVANKLIRKRDNGVPWNQKEQEEAAYYGVRG